MADARRLYATQDRRRRPGWIDRRVAVVLQRNMANLPVIGKGAEMKRPIKALATYLALSAASPVLAAPVVSTNNNFDVDGTTTPPTVLLAPKVHAVVRVRAGVYEISVADTKDFLNCAALATLEFIPNKPYGQGILVQRRSSNVNGDGTFTSRWLVYTLNIDGKADDFPFFLGVGRC